MISPEHRQPHGAVGGRRAGRRDPSPNDETRDKFGSYAEQHIHEILAIDPDAKGLEHHVLERDGTYRRVDEPSRPVALSRLPLVIEWQTGGALRLSWPGGLRTIELRDADTRSRQGPPTAPATPAI